MDLIMFLYTFWVISFDWYKDYRIFPISFNKLFELLPVFICVRANGYLCSICLDVNISSLALLFNSLVFKNIPLSNALYTISLPLTSTLALFNTSSFTFLTLYYVVLSYF